jgi:mannose-6-phosphate isomerase-like protein (cupin superfamily)
MSYIKNIITETEKNENFRTVLYTGQKSQLVVMAIPAGGEIGEETHPHLEQSLFIQSGCAKAILDGEESNVSVGDVIVVTPGTKHNVINTGDGVLKIFTVYAPANHIDGRIHATKKDADDDAVDEAFGESVQ